MSLNILCNRRNSTSASVLREHLDAGALDSMSGSYGDAVGDEVIINWGVAGQLVNTAPFKAFLNKPNAVYNAVHKPTTFSILDAADVAIPPYTVDTRTAREWYNNGYPVIGRSLTRGRGGDGIVFMSLEDQSYPFVRCPLYTRYIPKRREFRVHVIGDNTLVNEKKLRRGIDANAMTWRVRSARNGYIYSRHPENVPEGIELEALKVVKELSLDFGAVDVIYNEYYGKFFILEVNTAPGLTGQALDFYVNNFKDIIYNNNNNNNNITSL